MYALRQKSSTLVNINAIFYNGLKLFWETFFLFLRTISAYLLVGYIVPSEFRKENNFLFNFQHRKTF